MGEEQRLQHLPDVLCGGADGAEVEEEVPPGVGRLQHPQAVQSVPQGIPHRQQQHGAGAVLGSWVSNGVHELPGFAARPLVLGGEGGGVGGGGRGERRAM